MPFARWLVPLVAALVLMGQSLAGWAAAGRFGEAKCCCAKPARCKCGDHGTSGSSPELRRCGSTAKLVAPAPILADAPASPAPEGELRLTPVPPAPAPAALQPGRAAPPEPPPF